MNLGPVIPDVEDEKHDLTPRKRRRSGSDSKISSIESCEAGYETSDESGNSFFTNLSSGLCYLGQFVISLFNSV